jgi:endonuclease/exonuclease/phosphatase family metal-dependent hydrolase
MSPSCFRVATFNAYNLALPNVEFYPYRHYTSSEYRQKKNWIGEQLLRMKADLIGFQEVFHEQALQEAVAASPQHRDCKVIMAPRTRRGPTVGLASRFPILSHRVYDTFPAESLLEVEGAEIPLRHFSHPVLSARVQLSDRVECTVVVVHLKSKRPIFPEGIDRFDPIERAKGQARSLILRVAEATALRTILMEALQHRHQPVIVLGDVNDGGSAVTSQIVSGEPPWRKLSFEQKQALWDVVLYHVKDIQARQSYDDFYYTHIHNGRHESLDHIMVSQEFVAQNPHHIGRVIYVSVFNDHLVDETLSPESIEPWQSDHGQVVATIELR